MDDICRSNASRVVLVEGKDDCHVILALAGFQRLPETFGIYECGSDDLVFKRLNALIASPNPVKPEAIGVVLDAGTPESGGLAGRWQQLTAKLKPRGYQLPAAPEADGTILDGGFEKPRIGVWFMPNNSEAGMLEDFLLNCAPQHAVEVARRAVDLAVETQVATFKDVHRSKAVIHTYLAWQDEPGRPLGQSVTNRALQGDVPTAIRFAEWLRRLFA